MGIDRLLCLQGLLDSTIGQPLLPVRAVVYRVGHLMNVAILSARCTTLASDWPWRMNTR